MHRRKCILEQLLSQERRDSEFFPENIDMCAAFHSRRAYRNKDLEETLLDGVANELAIVISPPPPPPPPFVRIFL